MEYKKVICLLAVSAALVPTCTVNAMETDSVNAISNDTAAEVSTAAVASSAAEAEPSVNMEPAAESGNGAEETEPVPDSDSVNQPESSSEGNSSGTEFSAAEQETEEGIEETATSETETEEEDLLEIDETDLSMAAQTVESAYVASASETEQKVFEYLTGKMGLNTAAACGIMANMYMESGFILNNMENCKESSLGFTDATYTAAVDNGSYSSYSFIHDGAGYGLVQWTFWTGKQGLLQLAQSYNLSISNFTVQMDYLYQTIKEYGMLSTLQNIPNTAEGAYTAGDYFCQQYERPPQTSSSAVVRGNIAKTTFWTKYAGSSSGTSSTNISESGTSYNSSAGSASTGTTTNTTGTGTSAAGSSTQTKSAGTYKVTADCLNVRSNASTSGTILGGLYQNTTVTVLAVENGWGKINYNGQTAYIAMNYCTPVTTASATANTGSSTTTNTGSSTNTNTGSSTTANTGSTTTNTGNTAKGSAYTVTASALNVRSGAGLSYKVVGSYSKDTKVTVYQVSNGWGKVSYSGSDAWISMDYCKAVGTTTTASTEKAVSSADNSASSVYTVTAYVLNVRNTPSLYGSICGSLVEGTKVTIKSVTGNWGMISYNGSNAYICMDYCKK